MVFVVVVVGFSEEKNVCGFGSQYNSVSGAGGGGAGTIFLFHFIHLSLCSFDLITTIIINLMLQSFPSYFFVFVVFFFIWGVCLGSESL